MPMGYWTVISKDPFRFLICMQVGNHSLTLLKKYKEAALHFMPWSERQRVVDAGQISGRDVDKAAKLGFDLYPA
jgi:flavin reductase (DIM6/NTAB) family NADH-FMN oxidoreductase RutF